MGLAMALARPDPPKPLPPPSRIGETVLLAIPDVLTPAAAARLRETILAAEWIDGNATSGAGAATVKHNGSIITSSGGIP